MKKSTLKLSIRRETLRVLADVRLVGIVGGSLAPRQADSGDPANGCPNLVTCDSQSPAAGCPLFRVVPAATL
jgi:hypothetical protein